MPIAKASAGFVEPAVRWSSTGLRVGEEGAEVGGGLVGLGGDGGLEIGWGKPDVSTPWTAWHAGHGHTRALPSRDQELQNPFHETRTTRDIIK